MEVKKLIKTNKGTYKFEGKLTQEEHEYVFNVGLSSLLAQGAFMENQQQEEHEWPNDVSGETH